MSEFGVIAYLLSGFLLGLKHSLDSDHLIAISTIISEKPVRKYSAIKGVVWGLGHTSTLFITGIIILFFKLKIPAWLEGYFEMLVGFILIYLGLSLVLKIKKNKIHLHNHKHDGQNHLHLHSHKDEVDHSHYHKSFWVGTIHGLAGSAALMLMVLSGAKTLLIGLFFILTFGAGLIAGMAAFGFLASIPLLLASERFPNINHKLTLLIASTSTALGLSIVFHTI